MALTFQAPAVTRRPANPATELVRKGLAGAELGFTAPVFNDIPMIQAAGIMGDLPPTLLNLPVLHEGSRSDLKLAGIQTAPANVLSWNIEMPPAPTNGVWESEEVSSFEINRLVKALNQPVPAFPATWRWTLIIHPLPDPVSFMNHILWHEFQHVADHRWLAQQIIGPWQNWIDTAHQKRLVFSSESIFSLRNALLNPGNYATGYIRILRYWQSAIKQSGDLFHHTTKGATPVIKILKISGTPRIHSGKLQLHISIAASDPITQAITLDSLPHSFFQLRPLHHPIDGNESPITPAAHPVNRIIVAHNILDAADDAEISIDDANENWGDLYQA